MMKRKLMGLILCLALTFATAACGSESAPSKDTGNTSNSVTNVLQEQLKEAEADQSALSSNWQAASGDKASQFDKKKDAGDYDVDLTSLSSTMVYSEVYDMMTSPDDYIGKKVKMEGQFAIYRATDEEGNVIDDSMYFACVIADATACCSQGLEFVLDGDYSFPEDYPEVGEDITVAGTFDTYTEGDYLYCHLVDAVMQ